MATAETTQREILRLRKYNLLKQLVDLDWEETLCQDIRRFFTRPKKHRKFIQKRLDEIEHQLVVLGATAAERDVSNLADLERELEKRE